MKKDKKLLARIAFFKNELQKFKSGNLSEEEFSKLLVDEITYTKRNVIEIYEAELAEDQKETESLILIRHKLINNLKLQRQEEKIVLSIIS